MEVDYAYHAKTLIVTKLTNTKRNIIFMHHIRTPKACIRNHNPQIFIIN